MGYTARIVLVSAGLLALLLLVVGFGPRRTTAFVVDEAGPSTPTTVVATAPLCNDGSDTVTVVANAPRFNNVPLDAEISATFSCPVDHQAVERAFTIYPATKGRFEWRDQVLIFHPSEPLQLHTNYRVTFFGGQQDSRGFVNGRRVSWPFSTR